MSSKPCKFYIGDSDTALDYNQMREYLFKNPDFFEQGINPQISKTQIDEKATETGERAEVRKPDQETAKAGQERGISEGDSGQRGAQEVRQGEVPEVSGKGEEVTDQQIDQAAQKAGVKPKNLRDLYNINRELFGLDRIKSFASAVAMDRMVGAMAKRAGVTKEQMYGRLEFRKDTEQNVLKADNALFQGTVDGKPVTLRNLDVDVVNGFYSPIEKNLKEYGKDKIKAKDWLNVVGKGDEAVFTGVRAFLEGKDPNAMVSKQEILDYMKDNRISVVEVVKGEDSQRTKELLEKRNALFIKTGDIERSINAELSKGVNGVDINAVNSLLQEKNKVQKEFEDADREFNLAKKDDTKFSQYQLEGEKENYKEIMVILPRTGSMAKVGDYKVPAAHQYGEDLSDNRRLVHLRMNTRTDADGKKVLFLEEIQSDWGQTGKKEGFRGKKAKDTKSITVSETPETIVDEGTSRQKNNYVVFADGVRIGLVHGANKEDALSNAKKRMSENPNAVIISDKGTPTAPFVMDTNAWTKLGLKVALKEAVAQGVDKIAWTTGTQQFDRWGTEKIDWVSKGKRTESETKRMNALGEKILSYKETPSERAEYTRLVEKEGWTINIQEQFRGTAFEGMNVDEKALSEKGTTITSKEDLRAAIDRTLSREKNEAERQKLTDRIWDRMQKEDSGTSLPRKEGMESFYGTEGTKGMVGGVAEKVFGQKVGETKIETKTPSPEKFVAYDVYGGAPFEFENEAEAIKYAEKRLRDAKIQYEKRGNEYWEVGVTDEPVFRIYKGEEGQPTITTQSSVDITPALRAEVERGLALFQRQQGQQAKGAMVAADGAFVIYALTDPNVSTPLHEMAHVFEHYLTDAERAAVQSWAGTKGWTIETSEKFARGFEKYLAEGKAPTPALQKIFEKFKQWLTDIYNGITGSEIDIELNEQMREIYAKMLGSEAAATPPAPTTPPAAPKSELEALAEEFGKEVESAMKAKPFEKKAEAQEKAAEKTKKAQKKAQEETKETELAKEDSGDMLGDLFSEFNQKPEPPKQTLGIVPPAVARMMQPPPPAPTSIFPPAVQKRMDEARKKPQTESAYKKLLNRLNRLSNGFARQYQELAPVKYAEVIEILRKLKAAPGLAKTLAEMHMQNIWGDLNPTQRAHFQDYIIASDMLGSIEDGLYGTDVLWAGEKGPHGYNSFQEVRDAVAKGQAIVNADPKLKDAIDRRNAFVDRLWETSKKAGLASGEQIGSGQSYFHRKHLKYEEEGVALDAIMQSSARRKKPAQFKKRKGATSDYLTNFAEVEFGVVASTGFEIAKRQYINEIVKEYEPIYKSMKAEAKQEAQDAIDDIERTYGAGSPEHTIALENQKDLEDKILAQLMGDDYKLYFPDGKNSLFRTDVAMGTDVEDAITQAANGQTGLAIQNLTDALRPVVMLAKGRQIFIPTDIANLFDRLGEVKGDSEPIIEDFLEGVAGATKVVKKIYLLSPFRFPKYLVGNLAGDADKIAAADSGIPKKLPQAVKILWDAKKGKYDPWYTKAVKYGVFSGTLSDIGDVSEAAWSKFATDKNPDVGDFVRKAMENMGGVKWSIEKYFELVGRLANAREDAFRLAAFIRASEQIEKGKNIYWFSNKNVIDNLKDNEVKAAKLAREIFGDYIAISQSGEVLSKYLYPFYRFRETNIRGYKNFIFNNLNTKAGREKIIKYGVSRGLTVAATRLLIHSMQLALFTAIVAAYNSIFWPEEEEELRKGGDQSFHIITGRNSDGSIRVLRTQGTLNAFMESMGINGIRQFYQDYGNKDATMADVAKEPAKAFTNEFYQGVTPLIKVPFELASGKSRFPNVFRPRAIRDNTEYLFTSAALRQPYEMLTDAPRAKKDILSLFLTSDMNPKEIAYYQTLNKVSDDIGRVTMVSTPGTSVMSKRKTEKQDALYRWKMNVKFNNIEKADQALVEYYKLGGQAKDIKQSLRAINPLNNYSDFVQKSIETLADGKSIDFSNAKPVGRSDSKMFVKIGNTQYTANYDEIEYVRGLSKKDITMFKMALEYYKDIKDKSEAYLKKSDKKK